jgi:RNA polymerase sigma-70 factor (ECF subfamily)
MLVTSNLNLVADFMDKQPPVLPSCTATGAVRPAKEKDRSALSNELAGLVAQMAQGRQEALAGLYDETSPILNGLLLRILDRPQDAEEVLLDVYMKAWKNAGSYSPDRGTVQAWLFTMARSVAIDRIRQRRARPGTLPLEFQGISEPPSSDQTPEEQSVESQRRRRVQLLLNELPPEQRDVVTLAFFGGLTHSELAGRLGLPLGTIKSRIRTGLLHLRNRLEGFAIV